MEAFSELLLFGFLLWDLRRGKQVWCVSPADVDKLLDCSVFGADLICFAWPVVVLFLGADHVWGKCERLSPVLGVNLGSHGRAPRLTHTLAVSGAAERGARQ